MGSTSTSPLGEDLVEALVGLVHPAFHGAEHAVALLGGVEEARDNHPRAVAKVLDAPSQLKRPFIVADPEPLTIGEMIASMRHGLGRRGGLFPVPATVLKAALQALGHSETYRLFAGSLVADSSALRQVDWVPSTSTRAALAALMRESKDRNVA